MLSLTTLIGHLKMWFLLLTEIDIQYVDGKAMKGIVITN